MPFKPYESRFKAGQLLAEHVINKDSALRDQLRENSDKFFCFAIPNGGVPVAEGFSKKLNINYDLLIVRKIKIPYNTEAGFGSITTDGTVLINKPLLNRLNLTDIDVNNSINMTKREIKERLKLYNKESKLEKIIEQNVKERNIFMMDDGLASGFTMLASIKMVKKYEPKKIFVAVPTAPLSTIKIIQKEVDDIFCPNIRDVMRFAVADAYKNWYDVPESEVLEIITKSSFYFKKIKEK